VLGLGFYIGTALAPAMTAAAAQANFTMPEGAAQIISIADGFLWPPFLFHLMGRTMGWIGIGALAVLVLVLMFLFRRNPGPWERLAGAPRDGEDADLSVQPDVRMAPGD